jgi:glucose/arabinose dehydrogenase
MFGQSAELVELELELEPVPASVVVVDVVPADEEPVAACVIAAAPPAIVPARASVTMTFRSRVFMFADLLSRIRAVGSSEHRPAVIALGRGRERAESWGCCVALAGLFAAAACGSGGSGSSGGGLVPIGAGLQGPAGLRATVYATGLPLMSAFAFDVKGRLWVTTSGANTHGTDAVYLLERAGSRPAKIVEKIRGPLGLVWSHETLFVSTLDGVTAFSALHGTRFRRRETILRGPVAGAENNNIVQAPDGRLIMDVSSPCDHCVPTSSLSAAIVSFRTDGTDLRVYASRIRAAFGLAFYPGTSELLASMNQRDDLGARTPGDWLALVRAGQNWGFPACYGQGGTACAGVPQPVAVLDKHAAAGGVAILTRQLGGWFTGSALVAEWSLGKVQRVALTRNGSTYNGTVTPFLTGLENPLPVITAADGAVLVGDWKTGKIYRIIAR